MQEKEGCEYATMGADGALSQGKQNEYSSLTCTEDRQGLRGREAARLGPRTTQGRGEKQPGREAALFRHARSKIVGFEPLKSRLTFFSSKTLKSLLSYVPSGTVTSRSPARRGVELCPPLVKTPVSPLRGPVCTGSRAACLRVRQRRSPSPGQRSVLWPQTKLNCAHEQHQGTRFVHILASMVQENIYNFCSLLKCLNL